jgi:ribosome-associated protein
MHQAQARPEHSGLSTIVSITSMPNDIQAEAGSLLALVLHSLDEDQAQDVVSIPLEGKSSIADHMVIASGRSTRQVAAIATHLAERLKKAGHGNPRIEGLPAADWVLLDAGDVVVHLFRPEVRSFYNLERMWGFGDEAAVATGRA